MNMNPSNHQFKQPVICLCATSCDQAKVRNNCKRTLLTFQPIKIQMYKLYLLLLLSVKKVKDFMLTKTFLFLFLSLLSASTRSIVSTKNLSTSTFPSSKFSKPPDFQQCCQEAQLHFNLKVNMVEDTNTTTPESNPQSSVVSPQNPQLCHHIILSFFTPQSIVVSPHNPQLCHPRLISCVTPQYTVVSPPQSSVVSPHIHQLCHPTIHACFTPKILSCITPQ